MKRVINSACMLAIVPTLSSGRKFQDDPGRAAKTSPYTLCTSLKPGCLGQAVVRTGLHVQIVRLPQVLQRRGRGRSAHYEDISKGLFTRPVRIGARAVGWPDYEIEALIAAQVASTPPPGLRRLVQQLEERRQSVAPNLT